MLLSRSLTAEVPPTLELSLTLGLGNIVFHSAKARSVKKYQSVFRLLLSLWWSPYCLPHIDTWSFGYAEDSWS